MYLVEVDYKDGRDETEQLPTLSAVCRWLMSRRGVESVSIEKCIDATSPDRNDETVAVLKPVRRR